MKFKTLILMAFTALSTSALAGCGEVKPTFIDYAHNGSCQLSLEYQGHDFFKDGIGECSLKSPIDGDTAHFYSIEHNNSEVLKARFYGIDTPESTGNVQPYGKKASNFTKEKLLNASANGTIVVSSPFFSYKAPETDSTGSRYLSLIWINETKQHAPISELTLLNLWIVQEGLSWAKNVSEVPEFADTFQDAQDQAEKFALMMWSGPDPDYNYDQKYEDTSLVEIKNEVLACLEDPEHENKFDDTKVQVTGTVAGFADNTLYVEEKYETTQADGTKKVEYAGINVFVGMTTISSRYTAVGTYLRVVGLCLDSAQFGFQVTDTQGHWPASPSKDDSDCQVLLTAAENTGEHALKTFEYTANQINDLHSGSNNNYENLYCRTKITEPLICSRAFVSDGGDTTLYFKNASVSVYIPFQYYGNLEDTSDVWNTEDRFVGKSFNVEGVYSLHKTQSGKITYQIVPSTSADIECVTDKHGTVPSNLLSVDEAVAIADTLDGSDNEKTAITYYVQGIIASIENKGSSDATVILTGTSNNLKAYRAALGTGVNADDLKVGSVIYVKGNIQNYGGVPEVVSGTILAVYPHGGLESDPLTVAEAVALIATLPNGADGSPNVYYYVRGAIESVTTEEVSGATRYNLVLAGGLGVYQARLQNVEAAQLVVGAYVMVKGRLYNDNGSPFVRGSTYIIGVMN